MPRPARNLSIRDIIEEAVHRAVERATATIARAVRKAEAEQPRAPGRRASAGRGASKASRRSSSPEEMTRWVADRRARRVPTFVIDATGLDTKKKIVARYGESAVFEKGRPLPKPKASSEARLVKRPARSKPAKVPALSVEMTSEEESSEPVRARPPIIRKGAARVA